MAVEKYTLAEILEYGPLVAVDEEMMVAVTVNGSYANFWPMNGDGTFGAAFDVLHQEKDMYSRTAADFKDEGQRALEWLYEQMHEEEEEGDESDEDEDDEDEDIERTHTSSLDEDESVVNYDFLWTSEDHDEGMKEGWYWFFLTNKNRIYGPYQGPYETVKDVMLSGKAAVKSFYEE